MNFNETEDNEVDWTVFDKPLPPGTPVSPRDIEVNKEVEKRIAENRLKQHKLRDRQKKT